MLLADMGVTQPGGADPGKGKACCLDGRKEWARLDALLASALQGESGALVIRGMRGEAGVGKTALLDYAASRADAFRVLRATGVEAESSLALPGLESTFHEIVNAIAFK